MWLDVVCSPQALHAGRRNARRSRHSAATPASQVGGRARYCLQHFFLDRRVGQRRLAATPRCVGETGQAFLDEALIPVTHRHTCHPGFRTDCASCVCPSAASKMICARCRSRTDTVCLPTPGNHRERSQDQNLSRIRLNQYRVNNLKTSLGGDSILRFRLSI